MRGQAWDDRPGAAIRTTGRLDGGGPSAKPLLFAVLLLFGGIAFIVLGSIGLSVIPAPGWAEVTFWAGIAATFAAMPVMFRWSAKLAAGNRDLLRTGLPATALVQDLSDTGMTVNDRPMVRFDLEVRRPGAPPYLVRHRETVPRLIVGGVFPGSVLAVRVDPADPARLTIDWDIPPTGQPLWHA